MVSTRKRSYSSTQNDSGYDSEANSEQPIIKKSKSGIAESNKRKRKINTVAGGSEVKMNSMDRNKVNGNSENDSNETISKKPKISTNESTCTISTSSSSSSTPTIIEENIYCNKRIQNVLMKQFKTFVADPSSSKYCLENSSMAVECHHSCEKYGVCKNRFITNKSGLAENDIEIFYTDNKGYGIRAKREIAKGTYIGDYNGEIINEKEKQRRHRQKNNSGSTSFYMMKLEKFYIDAENFGSKMRYLNHSCDPNCKTKSYLAADGLPHICLFAIKNIFIGEELTFKYSPNRGHQNEQEFECYCSAKNCKKIFTA